MSSWGWKSERSEGLWRFGSSALRPLVAAAPWVTVMLLFLLFHSIAGSLTAAKGVLFELPDANPADGEATGLVALVMPVDRETLVFFDDARYSLGDEVSSGTFAGQLTERVSKSKAKTLLVLADRRVAGGELMRLADIARRSGVARLLFAEKKKELVE